MGKRICSVSGCGKPRYAKAFCRVHYDRHLRLGSPHLAPRPTLAERFWAKVEKTPDCWVWTGATGHGGYGQFWVSDERRLVGAHRVSLALAGLTIPDGQDVDHLCRNPACVNPDHLEPVTHAVNMERAPRTAIQFQAAKTHCPHGHEYTPENTYRRRNSSDTYSRECRTCRRARR